MKLLNNVTYDNWWSRKVWSLPANTDVYYEYKKRRLPLPYELAQKRYDHMVSLHQEGAPYAWIAKLYRMNRSQVYRIINKIPNN